MKHRWKKCMGMLICILTLFTSIPVQAEEVKISDKEYLLSLTNAGPLYISNDTAVSGEIGSKVFLTYTVAELTSDTAKQNGIIGAKDNNATYPYTEEYGGTMKYVDDSVLFEEGWTYVFRFERTEAGFEYSCVRMKGDKQVAIEFINTAKGGTVDDFNYYGIYCAGGTGVTALLSHVRCYDEKGNDLGIHLNHSSAVDQGELNELLNNHLTVDTSYDFTMEEKNTVAISNKYPTDCDVVYMEYEVTEVKDDKTSQQGIIVTRAPRTVYPHTDGNGLLKFKQFSGKEEEDKLLLRKGAKYFICFNKKEEGFDVVIQRTLNGVTEMISLPDNTGEYQQDFSYFSLWLGEGVNRGFSASFKNFKCYDADGNNLGIQVRDTNVKFTEKGEIGNYDTGIGDYYCEETDSFITLSEGQKVSRLTGTEKEEGTYKIYDGILYLYWKDGKESLDYTAMLLTDEEERAYVRMKTSYITFVTGEESFVVTTDINNSYRAVKPEDPVKKGNTFKGWYLGDGKAYDFNAVVTESITLYAKWQDGDGNEYLAIDSSNDTMFANGYYMISAIAISAVILLGCATACIIIARRKQNDKNKEKTGE